MFGKIKRRFLLGLYVWEHSVYQNMGRTNFPSIDCILSLKRILPFLKEVDLAPLDYSDYSMETFFPTIEKLALALNLVNAELLHSQNIKAVSAQMKKTTGLIWLTSIDGKTNSDVNNEIITELENLILYFETNPELNTRRFNGLLYRLARDLNQWLVLTRNAL